MTARIRFIALTLCLAFALSVALPAVGGIPTGLAGVHDGDQAVSHTTVALVALGSDRGSQRTLMQMIGGIGRALLGSALVACSVVVQPSSHGLTSWLRLSVLPLRI